MKKFINVLSQNKKYAMLFGFISGTTLAAIIQLVTIGLDSSIYINYLMIGIGIISYQISKNTKIRLSCAFLLTLIWKILENLLDKSFVDLSTLFLLILLALFYTGMYSLIFYIIDK
ncbi:MULTISPECIES: hypothetical protein [unclassified Enterococcus]|uniref:hypothetical protein n=1 Tax=unclassified Enterococcus TaxID=2608891 RepID=UPI001555EE55|nr:MULTISPECIES: hypothetical protein [unclassified Enterococcus]MBS7576032.1 hypothetical protein [Enterococcus sp. MMGLQ5-2]MBS7583265.1 hypothetical protein [Enterococcus sp. MMGLQ5-1]NPD11125.1 hypothetical protein [Enterococcus sp. MMGLQ5-1]NPD35868.1 hypothetical protein [Enterococcus sp. MMGLQ5-2]